MCFLEPLLVNDLRSLIPFVPIFMEVKNYEYWIHPIVFSYFLFKPVAASKIAGEKTALSFSAKEPGFEELFKSPKISNTKISLNDQITV